MSNFKEIKNYDTLFRKGNWNYCYSSEQRR